MRSEPDKISFELGFKQDFKTLRPHFYHIFLKIAGQTEEGNPPPPSPPCVI